MDHPQFNITAMFGRELTQAEAAKLPQGWAWHSHDHRRVLVYGVKAETMGNALDLVVDWVRSAVDDATLDLADAHARRAPA